MTTLKQRVEAENRERAAHGRPLLPVVDARRLVNHGGNQKWKPALAFRPGNDIDELSDLLSFLHAIRADGFQLMIKAGGSRHSWSPAAASTGVYIHPERMNFVRPVSGDAAQSATLRPDFERSLSDCVLIGSGTRIREVNESLWAMGMALPVLGGYDGQTIAGVVQTATHGSVLRSGPIASLVHAINLVDAQGARIRVERERGPSDPAAFATNYPGWTLRQDTELFDAALVSAGMFGVVHSYLVAAADAFYLEEKRTQMTLTALRDLLRGGNVYRLMDVEKPAWLGPDDGRSLEGHPGNLYHLEFLVNPHPTRGDHTVIATSRPFLVLNRQEPPEFATSRSDDKDLFRLLGRQARFSRPALTTWLSEHFPKVLAWLSVTVSRLFPQDVPALLDAGMDNMADKAFDGRSYNVFNIGDGQNSIPALSSEPTAPLRDDLYLEALNLILERVAHFAAQGKMHTGPLSLRFVAGSPAMLADPEDVCRFEIIFTAGTHHAPALIRDYEDALWARFHGDVRPHWGQINNLNAQTRSRLAEMFPRLDRWQELRQSFDPANVFLNDWQRELFG